MSTSESIYKVLIVRLHKALYRRSKKHRPENPCFMCRQPFSPCCCKACMPGVSKLNMKPYEMTHLHSCNSESLKKEK